MLLLACYLSFHTRYTQNQKTFTSACGIIKLRERTRFTVHEHRNSSSQSVDMHISLTSHIPSSFDHMHRYAHTTDAKTQLI